METLDAGRPLRDPAVRAAVRASPPIAVLSLALAIGGNTLIFGLLDGFVFNPFPYPDPDRLVAIGATFPKVSSDTTYIEALAGRIRRHQAQQDALTRLAAFDLGNRNVSGGDVPERVFTAFLLDDLFPVIGTRVRRSDAASRRRSSRRRVRPPPSSAIASGNRASALIPRSSTGRSGSAAGDRDRRRHAARTRADRHRPLDPLGRRPLDDADATCGSSRSSAGWRWVRPRRESTWS